jgi:hypothetical protein
VKSFGFFNSILCLLVALYGQVLLAQTTSSDATKIESAIWKNAGFLNVEISNTFFSPENKITSYNHQFDVTAVVFRNAGWNKNEVVESFRGVSKLYSECGILLRRLKLIMTDAPNGVVEVSYFTESKRSAFKLNLMSPQSSKPVFYFMKKLDPLPWAFSYIEGTPEAKELLNPTDSMEFKKAVGSSFVSSAIKTSWYKDHFGDPVQFAISHELGHILGVKNHVMKTDPEAASIMGGAISKMAEKILPLQCKVFKSSSILKKIESSQVAASK